ncbi:DUF4123 domain-containing protein [Jannaschia pohangensis]|uniref:DUF4123 domain-containing protein n=1 Tax=Jannaschia pohangensis TaxID=390807 RepID=A0A1I3P0N8_9RHOB|nr:DUF4123 domain-containing protein [Jannaschia pohangensis]SFJ14596.1 protein of unknown function [Jannaschia pohangensis]
MPSLIFEARVPNVLPLTGSAAQICERLSDAPPGAVQTLYGPEAPRNVFLLVDATLRAEVAGIFDLDSIDHPARCLFGGDAAEDYGDAAPWIADLSIPDPEGDLAFHRDFFARHWAADNSVLIQTDATMGEVRRHLRRFTKLPVRDDGRRLFFRFWDPRILPDFLRIIDHDAGRARRMMMTDDDVPLTYLVRTGDDVVQFRPDIPACVAVPVAPMYLNLADFDPISRAREAERRQRIANRITEDFRTELAGRKPEEIERLVTAALQRFGAFGFTRHAHLHFFAVWTVLYGLGFEEYDTTGKLQKICRSDAPEDERFRAFRKWFDTFTLEA